MPVSIFDAYHQLKSKFKFSIKKDVDVAINKLLFLT